MTTDPLKTRADALRELMAKASGGPWYLQDGAFGVNPWIGRGNYTTGAGKYLRAGCILNMVAHDERSEDAALIVALHNAAPALLDELDRLRTELTQTQAKAEKLAEALNDARAYIDGASPDWHYSKQEQLKEIDQALTEWSAK